MKYAFARFAAESLVILTRFRVEDILRREIQKKTVRTDHRAKPADMENRENTGPCVVTDCAHEALRGRRDEWHLFERWRWAR